MQLSLKNLKLDKQLKTTRCCGFVLAFCLWRERPARVYYIQASGLGKLLAHNVNQTTIAASGFVHCVNYY